MTTVKKNFQGIKKLFLTKKITIKAKY